MNNLIKLMCLSVLSITLNSCSSAENGTESSTVLLVGKTDVSIDSKAQTLSVNVVTNKKLTVSSDNSWCAPGTVKNVDDQNVSVSMSCADNTSEESRKAVVTFAAGELTKQCTVCQSGSASATWISDNQIKMPKGAASFDISMDKNQAYDISCSDWLSVASSNKATGIYKIAVRANHKTVNREGNIAFKVSGNVKRTVIVSQTGNFADLSAKELTAKINLGWNLGNTMETCGSETAWGSPVITQEIIHAAKMQGFSAVRIPCSWYAHSDTLSGTYKINDAWMKRVKEVVEYVLNEDMVAMLNIHWDKGWLENNCNQVLEPFVVKKQTVLWKQIAEAMSGYDENLIFASANEPNAESDAQVAVLQKYHQAFIDVVRGTGGNNEKRCVVIQAPSTGIDLAVKNHKYFPEDKVADKMIVEVHFYSPFNFVLMSKDETWGKMAYFWGAPNHYSSLIDGVDRNSTWGEESYVEDEFGSLKTALMDKGYPVILGEYGTMYRQLNDASAQQKHNDSRRYWYKYVTQQALKNGVKPFVWDTGGIINRRTLTIEDADAMNGILDGAK